MLVGFPAGAGALVLVLGGDRDSPGGEDVAFLQDPPADFVGAAACATCHREEYVAWEESQHAQAMQEATPTTVRGDFDDSELEVEGTLFRFFRRDDRFFARTTGADGQPADFEILYTFGIDPLQQYLVELRDGRIQPLPVAWDTRPEDAGGQRWFHLPPGGSVKHTDPLHWTGLQQNWNFMCADCHSTNVRRGYDADADRFATTWTDIDVGCEACHGPGSRHLEWANGRDDDDATRGLLARFTSRSEVGWTFQPGRPIARRSGPAETRAEVQVCAQCHSLREQVAEGYYAGASLLDYYLPALITSGVYQDDGQQLDEVYTYGSFAQSRMYAAGVTCSDCHDPHSGAVLRPGNSLCGQCHTPSEYDSPSHHFHAVDSEGAQCVSCHMPARTYMEIDDRRDHSLRVPRPDWSVSLGVPNACTQCHADRSDAWAADQVVRWYGGPANGFQRFAPSFHAGGAALVDVVLDASHPAWVRASALARLAAEPAGDLREAVRVGLASTDPMMRRSALAATETLPPQDRVNLSVPLLDDSIRIVRLEAARLIAPFAAQLPETLRPGFARVAEEYIQVQRQQADRPEKRIALGAFLGFLGRQSEAEAELLAAIRLAPALAPAYVNLADLYRQQGREDAVHNVLQLGLSRAPEDPSLHHSRGLAYVRARRLPDAIDELARASELASDNAQYAYVYAVALNSAGRGGEAIAVLERAIELHPSHREILIALTTFNRDAGRVADAIRHAEELVAAYPTDAEAAALLASLREGAGK